MNKKINICKICDKRFSSHANLVNHMKTHQKGNVYLKAEEGNKESDPKVEMKPKKKRRKMMDRLQEPKVYTCDICSKAFKTNFKLVRHSYIHLEVKPFPCEMCGRRFSRKDHRNVHYKLHYIENKNCTCRVCGQLFHSEANVVKHIQRVHNANNEHEDVICYDCGETFQYQAQLKRHYNLYHKLRYYCEICGCESLSDTSYRRHIKKHVLSLPYTCVMCHSNFLSVDAMRQHYCDAELSTPVADVVVRVIVRDSIDLEEEIQPSDQLLALKLEKKFDNRGRKCKYPKLEDMPMKENVAVENSFQNSSEPKLYIMSEKQNNGSGNQVTDDLARELKEISSSFNLDVDMEEDDDSMIRDAGEKNTEEEDEDFIPGADFSFESRPKYKSVKGNRIKKGKVYRRETDMKLICQYCDRPFEEEALKLAHEAVHTDINTARQGKGKGLLGCKFCSKLFVDQSKLGRHLRIHTEERPFVCQTCNKAFFRMDHLQRHEKMHTIEGAADVDLEQWNQCHICEDEFETIEELDVHSSIHSVEKADGRVDSLIHLCSFCDEYFTDMNDLQAHVDQQHPKCPQLFKCSFCPSSFTHLSAQLDHQCYCDENPSPISLVNGSKKTDVDVIDFLNTHSVCKSCGLRFESKQELTKHEFEIHQLGEFSCKTCELTFTDQNELDLHVTSFHEAVESLSATSKKSPKFSARKYAYVKQGKAIHQCKHCSESFSSIRDYLIHMRKHTSNHEENACFVCEEKFPTEQSLTEHMADHNDVVVEVGIPKNVEPEQLE
nr:zinc finger protein Xfin [Ciona intestinalis]|eukprot:XP_002126914.1 zinc finger protein Xfin [Ciona intestinalis]